MPAARRTPVACWNVPSTRSTSRAQTIARALAMRVPLGVALGELEVDVRVAVDADDLGRGPDALPERLLDGRRHAGEQLRERHALGRLDEVLAGQLGRIDRQPAGERLEVAADRHEPLARLAVPAGALGLGFGPGAEGDVEVGRHDVRLRLSPLPPMSGSWLAGTAVSMSKRRRSKRWCRSGVRPTAPPGNDKLRTFRSAPHELC